MTGLPMTSIDSLDKCKCVGHHLNTNLHKETINLHPYPRLVLFSVLGGLSSPFLHFLPLWTGFLPSQASAEELERGRHDYVAVSCFQTRDLSLSLCCEGVGYWTHRPSFAFSVFIGYF